MAAAAKINRVKALRGHLKRCTVGADIDPMIDFIATDDLGVWYFKMSGFDGNEGEYKGGEYLGIVKAGPKYPYAPPLLEFYTPTVVYPIRNSDFCVDIGKYHANNYPPQIGLDGFTKMVWAGLIGWESLGGGIRLNEGLQQDGRNAHIERIRAAASASHMYNVKNNAAILTLFEEAKAERANAIVDAPIPAPKVAVAEATPAISPARAAAKAKAREESVARRAAKAAALMVMGRHEKILPAVPNMPAVQDVQTAVPGMPAE